MAPSVLFHYTSQKGLMGILNERAMWASSILYLNDTAEYSHAIEILKAEAADLRTSVPIDDAPGLDMIIEYTESTLARDTFVCCFSENGDLLSQWRGYCPSGGGYSIGFDFDLLQAAADDQAFALQQCIYDVEHQKSLVRALLTKSLSTYHRLLGRSEITISTITMNEFMPIFHEIAPQLKHPSFSEEREWRLVLQRNVNLKRQAAPTWLSDGRRMLCSSVADNSEPASTPQPHRTQV